MRLVNQGFGFAYNVVASIINAPSATGVVDSSASFSHPNDTDPTLEASFLPNAYDTSDDTITLSTGNPGDPCEALTWEITWESSAGGKISRVLSPAAGRTCDVNGDAAVDIRDVRALMAFRNQSASGSAAAFDLDSDGRVTVLDARGCVLRCDQPRCAVAP